MAGFQKAIFWYLLVLLVQVTSEQWTEQVITQFNRGTLGAMGGQCPGGDLLLEVKKYEDFVSVFEKPFGANDFFATSTGINEYCIEMLIPFIADVDYEVGVLIHTRNTGVPHVFSVSVIDTQTPEVLTDVEEEIHEENWTYSLIKIKRRSSYKVRLEYTKTIEDDDNFFAIDKFILRIPIPPTTTPEEPSSTDSTDNTPTTEAPTTDPTDSTSPTEIPTTDPTDATPPTDAPTTDPTDKWKIISIVALTVCGCLIVFTALMVYFYFSVIRKLLLKNVTVFEPADPNPKVMQGKADLKSDGSTTCDTTIDQKSVTNSNSHLIDFEVVSDVTLPPCKANATLPPSTANVQLLSSTANAKPPLSTENSTLPPSTVNATLPHSTANATLPPSTAKASLPTSIVNATLPPSIANVQLLSSTSNSKPPLSTENATLPSSTANVALPPSTVNTTLPPSTVNATLPHSTANTTLPPSTVKAAIPPSTANATLPPSTANSTLPHSTVKATLPSSTETAILPPSTANANLPLSIANVSSLYRR